MSDLILRSFNNKTIRQRGDGFFSATDMCQASGKLFADWMRLKATGEYIHVLAEKYYGNSHNTPVESTSGNVTDPEKRGTWVDRRVGGS